MVELFLSLFENIWVKRVNVIHPESKKFKDTTAMKTMSKSQSSRFATLGVLCPSCMAKVLHL
jgi:hypothetical protein